MYLKSLEVHGFKSFANKIVFEFHNGITGIVGPNGSGKSNVGDAVRWVLGEQSAKQLRGGSMQDIIFSGTENRKAQGFAYVAITLDNSDHKLPIEYEEVTVARRVYRSGESEYLINGTSCRLKDVNELFYDTGIGKEGYSIIGQGQIDKILSGKPEERRELFDEAAGIVKYKRRKNTAVKKLEDEKQNLIRVNDILEELIKQIGPLEKQSEIAKIYLKKKEELKTFDVNLFLLEMVYVKEQMKQLEEKQLIAKGDLDETNQKFEEARVEYGRLEKELEAMDSNIEEKKEEYNNALLRKGQLEGQINVLKEQINTSKANDEHLKKRLSDIEKELGEKESQKEEVLTDNQDVQQIKSQIEEVQKEVKERLVAVHQAIQDSNHQIENDKNQIIELLNGRSSTKVKMQRYDTMLEQMSIRKSQLSQKVLKMKSDESVHDEAMEKYGYRLESVKEEIKNLEDHKESCQSQIHELQQQIHEDNQQIEIGNQKYHREVSRLESLKNMTERYDGYGNSIRKIMEQKERNPGILGVVADLIKVDKSYEIAIETALGGNIQNIVTEDEQTAKEMIQYLKGNRFGRATFLPLSSIGFKGSFQGERALLEEGVLGVASDLVKTEERYLGLTKYLLGRTLVVDTIDHAIIIARKFNHSFRMVTLEGESLNPGGSMTGGAFKNTSNLLGRRGEMEDLKKRTGVLKQKIEALSMTLNKNRDKRSSLREEVSKIEEELQQKRILQNTIHINMKQVQMKKDEAQLGYHDLHREGMEIEGQIRDINNSKSALDKELKESSLMEEELQERIIKRQEILENYKKEEEKTQGESEKIQIDYANLKQKVEFAQQNLERIQGECRKLEEEREGILSKAGIAQKEIKEKEFNISQIEETVKMAIKTMEKTSEEIEELTKEKERRSLQYKSFFNQREELSKRINQLDKECFKLNSQREKLEEISENQINYMWDEYELTLNSAIELKDDSYQDKTSLKKEILKTKEEIRTLGDVNVNAIEDYKNLSQRYEFLLAQHDDLVEAEKTLLHIIEELDSGMRIQFQEKFHQIQIEFDKVFKQLFGGGKGTLELEEEGDILEAGVKITSQPPGKKLQNMMQLSGGEKALTAIALLFAIQNLKPSPFCLLDEIEAALDDSNVSRYAQYLHKLTNHTQFIIITHRRGTMAAADRLYGITMQEKGVSTLVSVNLIEDELDK